MLNLSSYHSNGLPPVVWSNKVNLIGEKVYKPKIHFCEHCNKPILIYGRLIPCKHVFCFTCANLCLGHASQASTPNQSGFGPPFPPQPGPSEPPASNHAQSPPMQNLSPLNNSMNSSFSSSSNLNNHHNNHNFGTHTNERNRRRRHLRGNNSDNNSKNNNVGKEPEYHRKQNLELSGNLYKTVNNDDTASTSTPNTIQQDASIRSPNLNNVAQDNHHNLNQQQNHTPNLLQTSGCHRCGGRALRVERNTLNSIFVCQVGTCKRTYLSARDLQAHVTHRHSRIKQHNNNVAGTSSASLQAISSSPYMSSSSLMHLNNHSQSQNHNPRQSSSSSSTFNTAAVNNNNDNKSNSNHNSPNINQHQHPKRVRDIQNHHRRGGQRERERERERNERDRDRNRFDRERDSFQRARERERDSKEYHRQSLQRAAQWAEASAQMLEKGLTR